MISYELHKSAQGVDALLPGKSPQMAAEYVRSMQRYENPSLLLLVQPLRVNPLHGHRIDPSDYGESTACRMETEIEDRAASI
jgi:hypothetical protein